MHRILKRNLLIIIIILLAFFLRVYGINWDQGQHLHPDERFLTMVATSIKIPENLSNYFNPAKSTFSPYLAGYGFFVYGSFPLYLTKIMGVIFHLDNYNDIALLGRLLSALFDLGSLFMIYKIGRIIGKSDWFGLTGVLFFAPNVFSIQQSHFFTVDTFLTFFVSLFFYFILKALCSKKSKSKFYFSCAGLILGFATACKIISLFLLPFFFLAVAIKCYLGFRESKKKIAIRYFLEYAAVASAEFIFYLLVAYFIFRLLQPFYFSSTNFYDPRLSPQTINNFKELKSFDDPATTFPPAIQWQSKLSIVWPLLQMSLYGLGLPILIWATAGLIFLWKKCLKNFKENIGLAIISFYTFVFFFYQGTRFTMNMRYFYPLYPIIILIAVYALFNLIKSDKLRTFFIGATFLYSLLSGLAFLKIYSRPHSRVVASAWIYHNIISEATIAYEHWDDPLPLQLPEAVHRTYKFQEIPIFVPDDSQKWSLIKERLGRSDYYILSSNRAWGSIPAFSKKFPKTSLFYKKLFSEGLGMIKVAEFTSRPGIGPFEINDDDAEESFTVYDHPKVLVFKTVDREKLTRELEKIEDSFN